jgi:galactose mutarotase-like enzyme
VPTPGCPWAVHLAMTYALTDDGLSVRAVARHDEAGST